MRIAFIGCGRITESHLQAIHSLTHDSNVADTYSTRTYPVSLAGFYDPLSERASEMSTRWGGKEYQSVESLLDDGPDAVYITSPTGSHPEHFCSVAERNTAVFLEKPLALDPEAVQTILSSARASESITCTGLQWRYRKLTRVLQTAIEDADVHLISGQWFWFTPGVAWLRNRATGGGQHMDQLIHLIDLSVYLFGRARTVRGVFRDHPHEQYADFSNWDTYQACVEYTCGAIGSYVSSYRLDVPLDNRNRVLMQVVCPDLLLQYFPDRLVVLDSGGEQVYPEESGSSALDMVGRYEIESAFLEAVYTRDPSLIVSDVASVSHTMDVMFSLTRSALSGEPEVL